MTGARLVSVVDLGGTMNINRFASGYGGDLVWEQYGEGPGILLLHSEEGPESSRAFARELAAHSGVVLPHLPGFGESNPFRALNSVNDLAYLFLDFLDESGIDSIAVVGSSLGAWLALELAAIAPARFPTVALLGPVGVKLSGREEKDFADIFMLRPDTVAELSYHNPALASTDFNSKTLAEVTVTLKNRENVVRFGWNPYLHSSALLHHLVRVRQPVLVVSGEADRFVRIRYADDLAARLPQARVITLEQCGHFPDIERPRECAESVADFVTLAGRPASVAS